MEAVIETWVEVDGDDAEELCFGLDDVEDWDGAKSGVKAGTVAADALVVGSASFPKGLVV